jgi:hypothetical protein
MKPDEMIFIFKLADSVQVEVTQAAKPTKTSQVMLTQKFEPGRTMPRAYDITETMVGQLLLEHIAKENL